MKIRVGYVSNSSTCSFCIAGVIYDRNEFDIKYEDKEIFERIDKYFHAAHEYEYDFDSAEYLRYAMYPLFIYYNQEENLDMIGISIDRMEEFETKKDFMERAKKELINFGLKEDTDNVEFLYGTYRI